MTLAYPDVSNHEGAMVLEPGTVAVCAKASEGTGYTDPYYGHYRSEASRVGALFFAYHFLHQGSGVAQAEYCFAVTGPGVNAMIDHEPTTGSNPSVQDAVDFAVRYRQLGGLCTLDYLPHWYWQQLGSPSLQPLAAAGLSLISSSYTTYSDAGPGWASYGGMTPVIWQYTDAFSYSGQSVDFNAYQGSVADLQALLGYTQEADMTPDEHRLLANVERITSYMCRYADAAENGGTTADFREIPGLDFLTGGTVTVLNPVAYIEDLIAKVAVASPTVDVAALKAQFVAALTDPSVLQAQARADAVELHNDTPGS